MGKIVLPGQPAQAKQGDVPGIGRELGSGLVAGDPAADFLAKHGISTQALTESKTGIVGIESISGDRFPTEYAPSIEAEDEEIARYLILSDLYGNMQFMNQLRGVLPAIEHDAIIALGNMGTTELEIGMAAEVMGTSDKPVYFTPGPVESMKSFEAAIEEAKRVAGKEEIFNVAKYHPRVRSRNHNLMFLPGSFRPYQEGGYYIAPGDQFKTHNYKREDLPDLRVIGLEEYMRHLDPDQIGRYILFTYDPPKMETEEGIDREELVDITDKRTGKVYKNHPRAAIGEIPKEKYKTEDRVDNTGQEELARELQLSSISELVCSRNQSTAQQSCSREGGSLDNEEWATGRYFNGSGLEKGWLAVLEVKESTQGRNATLKTRVITEHGYEHIFKAHFS